MQESYKVLKQLPSNEDGTHGYEEVKMVGRQNLFSSEGDAQDWINKNHENGVQYFIGKEYKQSKEQ